MLYKKILLEGDYMMDWIYYPSQIDVSNAMQTDEPLLLLIAFDNSKVIIGIADECVEHHILLTKTGFNSNDIDEYYRFIISQSGADWTFVCPKDYMKIENQEFRINQFFSNGINECTKVLGIIGYEKEIQIPQRYRRHLSYLK